MKSFSSVLLACTLAIPSFAQDAKTNAAPEQPSAANKLMKLPLTFPAAAAELSAPLVLKDGSISQPERTELPAGGKAVFKFAIVKPGDYLIKAIVKGEGEDVNSFYINVDAQPEDPAMVWDFEVTNGFEERTVSWRGKGSPESNEIVPKKFKLTAGDHKLIIIGREPGELKSVSIRPVAE